MRFLLNSNINFQIEYKKQKVRAFPWFSFFRNCTGKRSQPLLLQQQKNKIVSIIYCDPVQDLYCVLISTHFAMVLASNFGTSIKGINYETRHLS